MTVGLLMPERFVVPCGQTVLELFEHKQMGIFAQLSEACMYPRPNDSGLVTKLNALHSKCVEQADSAHLLPALWTRA